MGWLGTTNDLTGEFKLSEGRLKDVDAAAASIGSAFESIKVVVKDWLKDFGRAEDGSFSISKAVEEIIDKLKAGKKFLEKWHKVIFAMVGLWALNKMGLMGFVTSSIKLIGQLIVKLGAAVFAKKALDAPAVGGAGKGIGGFLKGLGAGLASIGAVAAPAALGIGVITLGMLGLAVGIAAILKAIEFGKEGFKLLGNFLTNILATALEKLAPILDIVMGHLVDFAEVVGSVIVGAIKEVANVIESIGDSIARVVESYGEMKTGTIEATTEQIERLAHIPPDNLNKAAAGIVAMKDALDGFSPGFIGTIGGGLKSMFAGWTGSDTTSTLEKLANLGTPLAVTAGAVDVLTTAMAKYVELPIKAMVEPTKELVAAMSEFKKLEGVALNVQVAGMPEFNTTALEGKLDEISTNLDEIDKKLDTTGPIAQANRTTSDELYQLGK
jgi:hypothetical protein